MTDDAATVETSFLHTDAAQPADGPTPVEPSESRTRGLLRDAIQKVMAEIAFHEEEARKHLQQAEELRRDLRESFAFLQQERAEPSTPAEPAKPRPHEPVVEERPAAPSTKKKVGGKKGK